MEAMQTEHLLHLHSMSLQVSAWHDSLLCLACQHMAYQCCTCPRLGNFVALLQFHIMLIKLLLPTLPDSGARMCRVMC